MSVRTVTRLVAALFVLFYSSTLYAWPPTFGTEFNFTSNAIEKVLTIRLKKLGDAGHTPDDTEQDFVRKFSEAVEKKCNSFCTVEPHIGPRWGKMEYTVRFKDGFYFNISVDPTVVEVQTSPATLAQLSKQTSRMNEYIFDVAKELGLKVDTTAHLNIGALSAFKDKPKAFLGFFVDYSSRPALALGVFGKDIPNAPPISHLKREQKDSLRRLVEAVNRGHVNSIGEIADRINGYVYSDTPTFKGPGASTHYQGVGMKFLSRTPFPREDRPFEFRATLHPERAEDYLLTAELTQKRMEYIRAQTEDIYLLDQPKVMAYTPRELAMEYLIYINELGLDWEKYAAITPKSLQKTLSTGVNQRLLAGEANWTTENVRLFRKAVVQKVMISPWCRQQTIKVLLAHPNNDALIEAVLGELSRQSRHGVREKAVVRGVLAQIRDVPWIAQDETLNGKIGRTIAYLDRKPTPPLCALQIIKNYLFSFFR